MQPVMYRHCIWKVRYYSLYYQEIFNLFKHGEFLPENGLVRKLGELFCHYDVKEACSDVLFLICGFSSKNLNEVNMFNSAEINNKLPHFLCVVTIAGISWSHSCRNIRTEHSTLGTGTVYFSPPVPFTVGIAIIRWWSQVASVCTTMGNTTWRSTILWVLSNTLTQDITIM